MKLVRPNYSKWFYLTCLYGTMSFLGGLFVTMFQFIPLVFGIATIFLFLCGIESTNYFQTRYRNNARMLDSWDKALDIRAIEILFPSIAIVFLLISAGWLMPVLSPFILFPLWITGAIGMFAISLTLQLTGIDIRIYNDLPTAEDLSYYTSLDFWSAVYLTTIVTGFIHILLLGMLCGVIYFCLGFSKKYKLSSPQLQDSAI